MPSSRDIQEQRRKAIREILMEEPVSQQKELVDMLRERGIAATQSSVSRDLKEIRAVRIGDQWQLPTVEANSPFLKVVDYVREVKPAGPYLTLVMTQPGAGSLVAKAIEASRWGDVVGTVAGLDSVLVLTEDALDQKLLLLRLHHYAQDWEFAHLGEVLEHLEDSES
ncbi:MAG TPA: hypothetical protein VN493_06545 [Thermoanaerobaculia bacterium]|nr:hypothetical protein [Thermoanaerobaculia bacterium]